LGIALSLLSATWKYIAAALLIAALYFAAVHWLHSYADRYEAPKIAAITAERDAARAALSAYQEQQRTRAAQLVLDWSAARDRADALQKELDGERAKKFAGLADRARAGSGAVGSVRLPAPLVGVLNDSISAANSSQTAGPPSESGEDSPSVTLADLAAAKVTCDAYYADAVDQILGLQRFYHDIQRSNNAPSS